jgi:hypothetical protein
LAKHFGIDWMDRVDAHLGEIQDTTLLILKGHLLVEEALFSRLCELTSDQKHVTQARLSSFQTACIVRAFYPNGVPGHNQCDADQIWDAIFALNTIRNKLSHKLEQEGMADLLKRLFVTFEYEGEALDDPKLVRNLHGALAFLIAFANVLHR